VGKKLNVYTVGDIIVNSKDDLLFMIVSIDGKSALCSCYDRIRANFFDTSITKATLTREINKHENSDYIKHYRVIK
jgi:hypothetical protein